MNFFALIVYVFEYVVYYLLDEIPGIGKRLGGGIAGWSGGAISVIILFQRGIMGYSPQSGTVVALVTMITIVAILIIILLKERPDLRETFKFVIDIGIFFGIVMLGLAILLT